MLLGSDTDIEDRKRAETKLLEDEGELRRITDAIPHTIVALDAKGHSLYANQAMLDYTGHTWKMHSPRTIAPVSFIPKILGGCARSAKQAWLVACRLKPSNERSGRTASIAGSSSVTTRSTTNRDDWVAGMQREPTLMIACAPKTGCETKTLPCAKTSCAHPCSRKSSVTQRRCVKCWFKFRR